MTISRSSIMVAVVVAVAACSPAVPDAPAGIGGAGLHAGATGAGTGSVDETSGAGGASGTGGASSGNGAAGSVIGTAGGATGQSGGSGGDSGRGSGGEGTPAAGTGGSAPTPMSGPGCPAGAFLCEGFETQLAGALPRSPWTPDLRGKGQIMIDSSRAFSGQNAIHVQGTMSSDRANVQIPMVIDAKTVWVRFMMYAVSYPSSSGVHTRLMRLGTSAAAANGDPESSYSLANYNGTAIEKVNAVLQRSTAVHWNDSAYKNRWVCWEWEIDKTGGVGKVAPHIWVDSKELSLSPAGSASHGGTSPSWDPINFEVFIMGLDGYQPDAVRGDIWIDDLVINSQRVGCPAAR